MAQRILFGLMRSTCRVRAEDDHRVSASRDLGEARGNVLPWRACTFSRRTCVLTVTLLRQRECLMPVLQEFIRQHTVSPFREFQPRALRAFAAADEDGLASIAQFELALRKIRDGDPIASSSGGTSSPAPSWQRWREARR